MQKREFYLMSSDFSDSESSDSDDGVDYEQKDVRIDSDDSTTDGD